MPLYQYICRSCGSPTEIRHGINDKPDARCTECGGELERVFTVPRLNVANYTSRAQARYGRLSQDEMVARQRAEHEAVRLSEPLPETPPAGAQRTS
jgi:putative FmdB family regulatory protein